MKIISAVRIILIIAIIGACQSSQKEDGSSENAKYHSSKNIVIPNLFLENIPFGFTGYAFDVETYLAPSFLASNNIHQVNVIQLNDDNTANFLSGNSYDMGKADFLSKLSINDDGRVFEFSDKGLGEYASNEDINELKYTSNNLLKSLETRTNYGKILYEYFYKDKEEIQSKSVSENGKLIETVSYVMDSIIGVTYQLNCPANCNYTVIKIIKYNGVISEVELPMALNKLAELIEAKEDDFEYIKDVNSSIEIISYRDGLKMREETWNLKTNSSEDYTDYIYWNSKVLIKTIGKNNLWGGSFSQSREFLYNKNGDVKTVLGVFEQPETPDGGTLTTKHEFVYDAKGLLLELIEYRHRQDRDPEIEKVLQFQYF